MHCWKRCSTPIYLSLASYKDRALCEIGGAVCMPKGSLSHSNKPTRVLSVSRALPYCHIQRALHDQLECSLAMTHIVPIYTIK